MKSIVGGEPHLDVDLYGRLETARAFRCQGPPPSCRHPAFGDVRRFERAIVTPPAGPHCQQPSDGLICRFSSAARRDLSPMPTRPRSEEHTSELQSLMRISYAVFCLKK